MFFVLFEYVRKYCLLRAYIMRNYIFLKKFSLLPIFLIFLILLNVFLLIVGCMMDIFSATIIVVPLIKPIAAYFGIDPIHLAIIFIANLELGYLTPPVGMNLFLSAYRFDESMKSVYTSTMPFYFVMLFCVILITYFPILSTWLVGF